MLGTAESRKCRSGKRDHSGLSKAATQSVSTAHNEKELSTQGTSKTVNIVDFGEDKTSVLIEIYGHRYRALVGSGAEISMINRRITEQFPEAELFRSTEVTLHTATGTAITVAGEIKLTFRIGKQYIEHTFIFAKNLTQNVILGRDCLRRHGMKIDYGTNELQFRGICVPLESDAYLDSLVRTAGRKILQPQTATLIWGKFKGQKHLKKQMIYSVTAINTGYTKLEPGLMVANSVAKIAKQKKFPLLLCNNTNQTIKLNKGPVVARVEEVSGDLTPLTEMSNSCTSMTDDSMDKVNIPEEYQEELEKLLGENNDLFASTDLELGRTGAIKMKIDTGNHPPIRLKPYRTPLNQRPVVDKAVKDMLHANIIRPSNSSWNFPILLVPKKDGGSRFCVDFRKLNQITRSYVWPLPHIDNVFASLGNSNVFTAIDLKTGYWQVAMDEKDKEKVSFCCRAGLFSFNCMPYGLTNAPSVFQELMTHVLSRINGQFTTAYLDDIVIYSPTVEEHLVHLAEVFSRLRKIWTKNEIKQVQIHAKGN